MIWKIPPFPRVSKMSTLRSRFENISRQHRLYSHPSQSRWIADSATGARISAATLQRTLILTSRARPLLALDHGHCALWACHKEESSSHARCACGIHPHGSSVVAVVKSPPRHHCAYIHIYIPLSRKFALSRNCVEAFHIRLEEEETISRKMKKWNGRGNEREQKVAWDGHFSSASSAHAREEGATIGRRNFLRRRLIGHEDFTGRSEFEASSSRHRVVE